MQISKEIAARVSPEKLRRAKAYLEHKANGTRVPNGRFLALQEKRLTRRLTRRWQRQMDWVIETMADLSFMQQRQDEGKRVRVLERKDFAQELQAWIDGMPETDRIAQDVRAVARASFVKGARFSHTELNMGDYGVSFSLVNNDAVTYLDKLEDLHLSNYRGSIAYTTRKRIIRILTEAAQTGMSYQEASKLIKAQGESGVFSQARGELIAVRETRAAYETGKAEMVREFERATGTRSAKFWQTVEDDRVTPECNANEAAGWIDMELVFPSGDAAPPRKGNPRCRCHLRYAVLEPTQSASDLNAQ